jgi:hypothetical protein
VVSFEGDAQWYSQLKEAIPDNVELLRVASPEASREEIAAVLETRGWPAFDVVVIDGLDRHALVDVACRSVTDHGIIICDNAESFGFQEAFEAKDFARVDFFGYAPGVVLPHCTSVYFKPGSFLFDRRAPVPVIAYSD